MATTAAPTLTPFALPAFLLSVLNDDAVGEADLSALVPVGVDSALVFVAAACDCVAATLATEAMELEAAARRGSAALQYEVTVFSTGGFSWELGQLL